MEPLTTLASRAARRILLRGFVFALGPCLAIAGILGILAALADRLVGPGLAWWWFVAVPGGLGVLSAGVIAWMRRATPIMAASEVDDALRLQDRLSSALDLGQRAPNDPFVVIALRQSRELASKIRLSQALPIRIRPAWWSWTGALGAAAAIALLVPPMHLLMDQQAQAEQAQVEEQRSAAEKAIDEATRFDRDEMAEAEIEPDAPMADLASDEDLRRLDRIREQLNKGELRPDEAVTEAARVFEEQARRLEQEARDRQKASQALQERLASLSSGDKQSGRVREMADALSRGDAQAAQRAAEALEREMAGMSEQERAETLESLRDLADQLDRQGQQAQEDLDRARERAMESLMDRGLSEEDARNLLDETDPNALRETLESLGMDPNDAEELARRLSEQNRQRQAEEEAAQSLEELADSLRDAADDLEREQQASQEPTDTPDAPGEAPADQNGDGQQDQQDQQAQQDSQDPNAEQRQGDNAQQRPQDNGQQREQTGDPREPREQREQQEQQKKEQGEPQEGAECEEGSCESGESGKQGDAECDGSGQSTSPAGTQQTRDEQREGQSGEKREGQQQDQQKPDGSHAQGECSECDGSGPGAGQQRQTSGGSAGKEGAGMDRLRRQLDQMNNQQQSGRNSEQRAADARSRAQRLLEGLSPEERRQLEQLARAQQRESGAEPPATDRESVDLRRQGDGGRVVAQVEGQDSAEGRRQVRVSQRELLDELLAAQAAGDRARDDRTAATRRYTNVERYFQTTSQRLRERATDESGDGSGDSGTSGGASGRDE
ncbi:MAG: hypothetical protein EA380_11245 [Phycisphaeraceae bacterium]|nr:MAG: hypothetical protein EA380_11245 [Phycisphaeraceae bacterium]